MATGHDRSGGYSGTPLLKKLGFKPGQQVLLIDAPEAYLDWLGPDSASLEVRRLDRAAGSTLQGDPFAPCNSADGFPADTSRSDPGPPTPITAVHLFATEAATLAAWLPQLRASLDAKGMLWISWPKRASKVPTDLSEDILRTLALPLGFVDIKVCSVSPVWSALKLVIRVSARGV